MASKLHYVVHSDVLSLNMNAWCTHGSDVAVKMPFCVDVLQADCSQCTRQEDCCVLGLRRYPVANRWRSRQSIHVPRGKLEQSVPSTYITWSINSCLYFVWKPSQMRSAVRNVAKCFPTAIVSGRSRKKVLMICLQCYFCAVICLHVLLYEPQYFSYMQVVWSDVYHLTFSFSCRCLNL